MKEAIVIELNDSKFNDVLKNHETMIYYLIHKLGIRTEDNEFYQEGVIALWKAAETYDEARGKFSTYAYFLIHKALLSLIRKRNRQIDVEDAYKEKVTADLSQMTATLETGFDAYLLKKIEQALTGKQMAWFTLFVLQDLSVKNIAEKEGVTIDAVKSWAKQAKPKIQKLLHSELYLNPNL